MSGRRRGPSLSNSARYRSLFTTSEDHQLARLVGDIGEDDWAKVASHMHNRTARQCRERWFTYLSPKVNLSAWSHDEDVILVQLFPEIGTSWSRYLAYFNNRTVNNIKNRWHTLSRRKDFHERFPMMDLSLLAPREKTAAPAAQPAAPATASSAPASADQSAQDSPARALPPEEVLQVFSIANLLNPPKNPVVA